MNLMALGIEDYKLASSDVRRYMTAVMDTYAGLLLLFKVHLMEETKDLDCNAVFKNGISKGIDGKSINFDQVMMALKERNIDVNQDKLRRIQPYRNRCEHLCDNEKVAAKVVREYIVDMMCIASSFLRNVMKENPVDAFPRETWSIFLEEKRIVDELSAMSVAALDDLKWYSQRARNLFGTYACAKCGGSLFMPEDDEKTENAAQRNFKCQACGAVHSYENIMFDLTDDLFSGSVVYGREVAHEISSFAGLGECPECSAMSFDCEEGVCFICGHRQEPPVCDVCFTEIGPEEMPCWNESHLCCHCRDLFERDD